MKRVLLVACLIISVLTISSVYGAEVNVQINGKDINFEDTNAQIINDRTMVPFRKIFNELGVTNENIDWDGETKTIIAKKNEVEIKLQIGNTTAEKKIDSKTSIINLDSAPVIINDRTLVPLRFIAESLGKYVSWDSISRTAIINDELTKNVNITNDDYYMNAIRNKSEALYNFLNTKSSNIQVSITRNYTDKENGNNNNSAVVDAAIAETKNGNAIHQDVTIVFSGTNDLMKDIASEGWSNIHYESDYYDTYFTTKALTDGWKKVYGQEQLKFLYSGINCNGKNSDTISDLFKGIISNGNSSVNEQVAREEFNELLYKLQPGGNWTLTTGDISSESIEMNYFDLTKLDNTMFDSPLNRVWCFLNSQIFNYDITWEELRYDYPTMRLSLNAKNSELMIDFVLSNEYNERVEYIIKINK